LVLLVVVLLGGSIAWTVMSRTARQAFLQQEVSRALDEAANCYQGDKLAQARAAVERAEGLLVSGGGGDELQGRVRRWRADLDFVAELEEIRLKQAAVKNERFDSAGADAAYREALRNHGLDFEALTPEEAAGLIRAAVINERLLAALDDWVLVKFTCNLPGWQSLLAVARRADADRWRDQLRDAFERRDRGTLKRLARDRELLTQPPATLHFLGIVLASIGEVPLAVEVFQQAQERHPSDFWSNAELAFQLMKLKPAQAREALGFYRAALVLRPDSPGVYLNLGVCLRAQGRVDQAIAAYRKALELKPDYVAAHTCLGNALDQHGDHSQAIAAYRKAIELKPDDAEAHYSLGTNLHTQGLLDDAHAELREAIRLNPKHAKALVNLGLVLRERGRRDEGIAHYRRAIEADPDLVEAHYNLACSLLTDHGNLDEAIAEFRKVIKLEPDDAGVHCNLGTALNRRGQVEEAIWHWRKAIELREDSAEAHCSLGQALRKAGQFTEALNHLKRGHELGSRDPHWPHPTAQWVRECETLVQLDTKLPRVLKGELQVADPRERISLAELCHLKRYFDLAARFYEEALAQEFPLGDDLKSVVRYNAACAAALAGIGEGQDASSLKEEQRAHRRRQARDWLQAELKQHARSLEEAAPMARAATAKTLQHWLGDRDLRGLRDDVYLAKLPPEERETCVKLWNEVRQLLERAQTKK
jgi:tetratricopeptide (TPR) repeat protein